MLSCSKLRMTTWPEKIEANSQRRSAAIRPGKRRRKCPSISVQGTSARRKVHRRFKTTGLNWCATAIAERANKNAAEGFASAALPVFETPYSDLSIFQKIGVA